MSEYVKLEKAPQWVIQYPTCSVCEVDLETDSDGWTCPSCGSLWDMRASDGDEGELYESWSGERLNGPLVGPEQAARLAYQQKRRETQAALRRAPVRSGEQQ